MPVPTLSTNVIILPNLNSLILSVFPDNGLNPHYASTYPQSRTWIKSYSDPLFGEEMRQFLERCDFELFAAYIVPKAEEEVLRSAMDLANLLWLYDEYTDAENGVNAKKAATIVAKTLKDREFDDGSWICRLIRDFHTHHISPKAGPNVSHRFTQNFIKYVTCVGDEATLREQREVLDIDAYVTLRRESSAMKPTFDLIEAGLGLDLPQYVHEDQDFVKGYNSTMDLPCWANDIYSYNMEQSKGHSTANILTVLSKSKQIPLQSAVDYAASHCATLATQFLEARTNLSSRSDPVFSRDAVRLLDALGDAVVGNERYSFATERYFGKECREVNESRVVRLRMPTSGMGSMS